MSFPELPSLSACQQERRGGSGHRVALLAAGITMLVAVVACSDATVDPGTSAEGDRPTRRQSIRDGTVDQVHTAVVGIRRPRGLCTGTLVAPNLVLTAQHCIAEISGDRRDGCSQITFDPPIDPGRVGVTTETRIGGNTNYIRGEAIDTPEGNEVCGEDIALIRLRRSVGADEALPRPPKVEQSAEAGDPYTAMGYGRTGPNESGSSGVRRRREDRTVRCLESNCSEFYVRRGQFMGGGGPCSGDSGGGAYAPNRRVFGVANRAPDSCVKALYTGTRRWRALLRQSARDAAQAGGYQTPGWASSGSDNDSDGDGFGDLYDNCPDVENPKQRDFDNDRNGDACDSDSDNDGIADEEDNCPEEPNANQYDLDGDGEGDVCDRDRDGDGVRDESDLCPDLRNPEQETSGPKLSCLDDDGDGVANAEDNCPNTPNPEQRNGDGDEAGMACDPDERPGDAGPDGGTKQGGDAGSGDAGPVPVPVEPGDRGCSCSATNEPSAVPTVLLALLLIPVFARRFFGCGAAE